MTAPVRPMFSPGDPCPAAATSTGLKVATAPNDAIEPMDRLLSADDVYRLPPAAVDRLRTTLVAQSVEHHIEGNPAFRGYCSKLGYRADIRTVDDLAAVPILPSSVFKRRDLKIATGPNGNDGPQVLATTSSGTQGSVSIVPRDDTTLMRFFASVSVGVREILGVDDFSMAAMNPGPSPEEAKNLWIAYVLAGASVFFDSVNYVVDGTFRRARLIEDLRAADRPVILAGPPGLVLDLCATGESLPLDPASLIVTVGGWKRAVGDMVDRAAFRASCAQTFAIDPTRVRDTFNMVELNTVLFECAHGTKHVPPWLHVSARHPRTLEIVPEGQVGVLAYLDPTAQSYPAFILSDDFGWVWRRHACACGLHTDTMALDRRINRIEARGCALKMDYAATDGAVSR